MDIDNFTASDLLLIAELTPLAVEAREAHDLIHECFSHSFGIGEEKIEVWHDRDMNNFEYLTKDGVWQARYLHQSYDIPCTVEDIYKCFKAAYFKENYEDGLIAQYFRSFVSRLKRS